MSPNTTEHIVWTALPAGNRRTPDGAFLKMSVFVAPRLASDRSATLADFGSWRDWPTYVKEMGLSFAVTFDGNRAADPPTIVSAPPSSAHWTAIFPSTTRVDAYRPADLSTTEIRSYPAAAAAKAITDIHRRWLTGRNPFAPPSVTELVDLLPGDLVEPPDSASSRAYGRAYADYTQRGIAALSNPPDVNAAHLPLGLVKHFYDRGTLPSRARPLTAPTFDFHQAISSLGAYPLVLRQLGLVFDLTLPFPDLSNGDHVVAAEPVWAIDPGPAVTPSSPGVMCTLPAFRVTYRAPFIQADLLTLDDAATFTVDEIDADGGALEILGAASAYRGRGGANATAPADVESTLPSIRSAGIAVNHVDRHLVTKSRIASQAAADAQLRQAQPVTLAGDDLVRGYRVWVLGDGPLGVVGLPQGWHPLMSRDGTYTFGALPAETATDLGFVALSATGDAGDVLYLHESMFRWNGWSLAASRPGTAISPANTNEPTTNPPAAGFHFAATFRATPHTLLQLRFGCTYSFLLAVVDLAGNSSVTDPAQLLESGQPHASAPFLYSRYDPVATPLVTRSGNVSPAASPADGTELLVVRSNPATDGTRPFAADSAKATQRFIAPPRISQMLAEQHGLFDSPGISPLGTREAYNRIVAADNHVADVKEPPTVTSFPVDYIYDPLAAGATLSIPGASVTIPFVGGDSVHPVSFVLELATQGATVFPTTPGSTARLVLGPAVTGEVDMSCSLVPQALDDARPLLGLWKDMDQARRDALRNGARTGLLWQFTPRRKLRFVHAVRQPVQPAGVNIGGDPSQPAISVASTLGHTDVAISGPVTWDVSSTSKVDLMANRHEIVEDPSAPDGVRRYDTIEAAFTLTDKALNSDGPGLTGTHQVGDTRARRVDYWTIATSAFTEHFAGTTRVTMPASGPVLIDARAISPNSETVSLPGGPTFTRSTPTTSGDYEVDPDAGTIQRSLGSSIPAGAQVEVTYLPRVTWDSRQDAFGKGLPAANGFVAGTAAIQIPTRSHPEGLAVTEIVPTFAWRNGRRSNQINSSRRGGGLRVYLQRPWYTSGDDELLGVLVPNSWVGLPAGTASAFPQFLTQIARDPIWNTKAPQPGLSLFDGYATTDLATLVEAPTSIVGIVGYPVRWSAEHQLWYSDILIDPGTSYFPFVRLALARYQPHCLREPQHGKSVGTTAISRVVTADFAQLAPDRLATVTYPNGPGQPVALTVTGTSFIPSPAARIAARTVVAVQTCPQGHIGDDLAWQDVPGGLHTAFASVAADGTATWTFASIPYPTNPGTAVRLVLREIDKTQTGNGFPFPILPLVPGAPTATIPVGHTPYADSIILAGGVT